ncbi:MAG: RNA 2',3'-cyclic phosphodiesterase [Chloroflexi bacterium]|nr:RNA 2',3'-cyclic phosphodiesterase [Chloroflexota bacterium]
MSKSAPGGQIRTFLAIELPAGLRAGLAALQEAFAEQTSMLKWVAPDRLHLTLRFLGNVPEARLDSVRQSVEAAAASVSTFALELNGIGAFPDERAPRVVWVGLQDGPALDRIRHLAGAVNDELASRGFEREDRPFKAHITLARVRDEASPGSRRHLGETLLAVRSARRISGRIPVDHVTIMRSDLGRAGPTYTPLAVVHLASP